MAKFTWKRALPIGDKPAYFLVKEKHLVVLRTGAKLIDYAPTTQTFDDCLTLGNPAKVLDFTIKWGFFFERSHTAEVFHTAMNLSEKLRLIREGAGVRDETWVRSVLSIHPMYVGSAHQKVDGTFECIREPNTLADWARDRLLLEIAGQVQCAHEGCAKIIPRRRNGKTRCRPREFCEKHSTRAARFERENRRLLAANSKPNHTRKES